MVKKADSQGTKDDSNDANKQAAPRSNHQLQKALKRKKVTQSCLLISFSVQNRQNRQQTKQLQT